VLVRQHVEVAFLLAYGIGDGEEQAEDDQHGGHDPHAAEDGLDLVLEQQSQDDDRQASHDDQPAHPGVRILARHFSAE
jgi:hypothetical protein